MTVNKKAEAKAKAKEMLQVKHVAINMTLFRTLAFS